MDHDIVMVPAVDFHALVDRVTTLEQVVLALVAGVQEEPVPAPTQGQVLAGALHRFRQEKHRREA